MPTLPIAPAHQMHYEVEPWARRTMASRLGDRVPGPGTAWWIAFMGRTAVSTQVGFMTTIACAAIRADVGRITCPTLVITIEGSGLASVEETRAWRQTIPRSELLVLPGNSFHVAASDAVRCAAATLDFVARAGAGPAPVAAPSSHARP
jgi:3-oxoadipate enol-lactonase